MSETIWFQREIRLRARPRGFHLITDELIGQLPELRQLAIGHCQFFIQHTSASLTINENADPDVRGDLDRWLRHVAPEQAAYFRHTCEGPDDMPAHIGASLLGASVTIPIQRGQLALGTWQGVYLGEHRDRGGPRTLVATLHGSASGRVA